MRSSINGSVIKSTTIELISPKLVDSPAFERFNQRQSVIKGASIVYNLALTDYEQNLPDYNPASLEIQVDYQNLSPLIREEEVLKLILQARKEAEMIIDDARKEAELILKEAYAERETLRQNMEEAIREEVIPQAQTEGYQKGIRDAEEEAEKTRKQAKKYLLIAQTALMEEFKRVDKELVDLCIKITERIIHSSLYVEPTGLLNIIRTLTLMPREKQNLKIHISNEDWEWFKRLSDEDKPPYAVIVNESLKSGDAFLECEEGIFDARIDSQLAKMEQFLLEELANGRLDGSGQED